MMGRTSMVWFLGVVALSATGCFVSTEVEPQNEVAVTEQALGGVAEVVRFGAGSVLDVGPTYTVFRRRVGSCDTIEVYITTTGERVPSPALPGCPSITVGTSQSLILVADRASGKIYRLNFGFFTSWSVAASPGTSVIVRQVLNNDTDLFWQGDSLIHRVSLSTGVEPQSPKMIAGLARMMAIEGSRLYLNTDNFNSGYDLVSLYWFKNGVSSTGVIATSPNTFDSYFTYDDSYIYWTHDYGVNNVNTLRRVGKELGSTVVDYRSSSAIFYRAPVANVSTLWWIEENLLTEVSQIKRKNLVNGNQSSASFPLKPPGRMRLLSDGLYFPSLTSLTDWSLYRTQR